MKKRIIYFLLPLCVAFLPSCSKSYTLTLVNSNDECGAILTESGKYKAGQEVRIELELTQGYIVKNWIDDSGAKIGSRSSFNFMMPKKDTTLTVNYDIGSFKLNFKDKVLADQNHYDFHDWFFGFTHLSCNDGPHWTEQYETYKWHDQVNLKYLFNSVSDYVSYHGWYDEDDNKLGDTTATFEMPNDDCNVYAKYTSNCIGIRADVTTNISNFFQVNCESRVSNKYYSDDLCADIVIFDDDYANDLTITFVGDTIPGVIFDYWYDVDNDQILTSQKTYTFSSLSAYRYLKAVVHRV